MSRKRIVIIVLAVIGIIVIGIVGFYGIGYYIMTKGPALSEVKYLKDPQITERDDEKVISISLEGIPGQISGQAIGDLYQIYYQLDVDKSKPVAPKGRWKDFGADSEDLKGEFAITVPDNVTELPNDKAVIKAWNYGEVAEILHVGSYAEEEKTIEKLENYIEDQGYEIVGDHEEEYLKGPGFIFDNPDKYLTVIRYQVRKIEE